MNLTHGHTSMRPRRARGPTVDVRTTPRTRRNADKCRISLVPGRGTAIAQREDDHSKGDPMLRRIALATLIVLSFSACQSDPEPEPDPKSGTGVVVETDPVAATVSAYCERLDECNYLAAGTSINECIAEI